jgi:beta-galactosidase/beta-glucuronidase
MECYQPDYPRPQFVRGGDSWFSLNGPWNFAFDDQDEGVDRAWFRSFPAASREIQVPFSYEYPASGIGSQERHDLVWYQRELDLRKPAAGDRRIMLHFEGCDYHTRVWVNGGFAGEHTGAYARFSFDISSLAVPGRNTITVRAADSFGRGQPRGKQRWKNQNYDCWYVQTTGIWKTVWIEYVPQVRIASVKMTPVLQTGTLELEAELAGPAFAGDSGDLVFEATVSYQGQGVNTIRAAGKRRLRLSIDITSCALHERGVLTWSPRCPALYDITFTLIRDGNPLDQVRSYFGMREIRIQGSQVLLNGQPLYQRLILDQGYWKDSGLTPPSEQALIEDIDKAISAGYNGVRKHQKIEDERFLYWADMKGLLVWSEMAAAYEFNDRALTEFTQQWMEIVCQQYNHPSIIVWTPFNESWGIPEIRSSPIQQQFTQAVYYLTKTYDPYRPVICNDGWEHTISDIITLHDYVERGEEFLERYGKNLEAILENRLFHNLRQPAFADGFAYLNQPVIISEFGGIAFNNGEAGWGYGDKVTDQKDFIRRFDAITTAIKKIEIIRGYCYTQLTDVQQEINGIMDAERNFKLDPEALREINERETGSLQRIL